MFSPMVTDAEKTLIKAHRKVMAGLGLAQEMENLTGIDAQKIALISRHNAASLLDCSIDTIDRLCRDGFLDKKKIGRSAKITLFSVKRFLDKKPDHE